MFERVHLIWDLYDGPRTGIADFCSSPHYFSCIFEDKGYSERFELHPINQVFFDLASEQWKIFRNWEMKFHTGKVTIETHPGNRSQNSRYDELEDILQKKIKELSKLQFKFEANFQVLSGQSALPAGVLRNLKVEWNRIT